MAADLRSAIASGVFQVGELISGANFNGMSDYNTLAVRLSDKPTAGVIAARIAHEFYHIQHQLLAGADQQHWPDECIEALAYVATFETLLIASCMTTVVVDGATIQVGPIACSRLDARWQDAWDWCEACVLMHDCLDVTGLFAYECCRHGV